MKKIWLALASMVLAFGVSAADISEGKQYTNLSKPVAGAPQVVEFFSFIALIAISFLKCIRSIVQLKKMYQKTPKWLVTTLTS